MTTGPTGGQTAADVSAVRIFAEARIGGEPIPSTATSELMLHTATKALGSGATLIDSVAGRVPAAKPITKILRGAGVAVYTLSDTLGGKGLKRGFGLAVLALGASLVAISLLSGAAPAWMATLGFGILLGGLAYAALASGMLVLALVLVTPVIPLLVWSMTRPEAPGDSGPERIIQIGLLVLLILTAMVMGTVTVPERSPVRWLSSVAWRRVLVVASIAILGLGVVGWLCWFLVVLVLDVSRPQGFDLTWGWVTVVGLMLLGFCLVVTARALQHVRELNGTPAGPSPARAAERSAASALRTAATAQAVLQDPGGTGPTSAGVDELAASVREAVTSAHLAAAGARQAALSARTAQQGARTVAEAAVARAREVADVLTTSTDPKSAQAARRARGAARDATSWLGPAELLPAALAHVAEGAGRAASIAERAAQLGTGDTADAIRLAGQSARLAATGVATAAGRLEGTRLIAASRAGDAARAASRVAAALDHLATSPGGAFATGAARLSRDHADHAESAAASVAPEGQAGRHRSAAVAAWAWVFGAAYLLITILAGGIALWLSSTGRPLGDSAVQAVLVMMVTFGALCLLCQAGTLSIQPPGSAERPRR